MTEVEDTAARLLADANSDEAPQELALLKGWSYAGQHWAGGMGGVALIAKGNERAALKFILPKFHLDERARTLFFRECDNMRALRHPNVVAVGGAGAHKEICFFTMEYCVGGSVWDLQKAGQIPLPVRRAVELAMQVLDGLRYAHHAEVPHVRLANGTYAAGHGLVHRDIKPQNIFLQGTGNNVVAKIGDFGLAKAYLLAGQSGVTAPWAKGGTFAFMPRQQAEDFLYAKPEVDVWAVAASLYWMLTCLIPRDGGDDDPLRWIRKTDPTSIRKRPGAAAIPDKLAKLLDRTLDDRSELAYQSAEEFRSALQACL